jgi:hypothetical protein
MPREAHDLGYDDSYEYNKSDKRLKRPVQKAAHKDHYDMLAPNAGISDYNYSEDGMKRMAETHGEGMGYGIGKKVSTADVHMYGDMGYAMTQDGNGSMNYERVKQMKNHSDVKKVRKKFMNEGMHEGNER